MKSFIAAWIAVFSLAVISGTASAQSSGAFQNGSFDTSLAGWTLNGGFAQPGSYPVVEDYLPSGQYGRTTAVPSLISVSASAVDPNTDGALHEAFSGPAAAALNLARFRGSYSNNLVSVMSQRVNNYASNTVSFAYAAVLQDPHGAFPPNVFVTTLMDNTTNEIVYSYNLDPLTSPTAFTLSSTGWYYTSWLTQNIDVSSRVGHDFTLSFLASDALVPQAGKNDLYMDKLGYVYIDGVGSVPGGPGTNPYVPPVATNYWDGGSRSHGANATIDGGDGIWAASGTSNWTDATGTTEGVYSPNPSVAVFAGAPGTVTVDRGYGLIRVTGMQFLTTDYTLKGDPVEVMGNAVIQVGGNADDYAQIDVNLQGYGTLTKTGPGTLYLRAYSAYSGTTEVQTGTLLFVNNDAAYSGAMISSPITVDNGATLGGTGEVGGIVAKTGSTVSPGLPEARIGWLTAANYSQEGGATLQYELESGGNAIGDQVAVRNKASLSPGAVLNVTNLDSAPYRFGTRYVVISAPGGVTGTFHLTGNTQATYFTGLVDHYDATHVYLDVAQTRSFASAGITPNQIAAGGGADTKSGAMYTAIVSMPNQAAAIAAFDQVSGEVHAGVAGSAMEDSRFVRDAMTGRTTEQGNHGHASWATALDSRGVTGSDGNAAEVKRAISGVVFGQDVIRTRHLVLGASGGFDQGKLNLIDRRSAAIFNDFHFGLYGGATVGAFGVHLGTAFTSRYVKTNRAVAFTGFSDNLDSKYHLDISQAVADVGYRLATRRSTLEPFVSAAYVAVNLKAAAEHGGAAALTIVKDNLHATFATAGLRATHALGTAPFGGLVLHGMIGYRHADGDTNPSAALAFTGGSPFNVQSVPLTRNAAVVDAGIKGSIGPRTTVDVHYSGVRGSRFHDDGVFVTLRYVMGPVLSR